MRERKCRLNRVSVTADRARVTGRIIAPLSSFLGWLVLAGAAHAQPDAWERDVERGRALVAAEQWDRAADVLRRVHNALRDHDDERRYGFSCEFGVALLRSGDDAGHVALADGLAQARGARDQECATMYADALRAVGEGERAAFLYLHALALGAPAEVRERYEELDPAVRARAETALTALRTQPLVSFVPPSATPAALADAIARWTMLARPTRQAQCFVEAGIQVASDGLGLITCWYSDAPMAEPGMAVHPLEAFIWERRGALVHAVASFSAGVAHDCEAGHVVHPRSISVLTSTRNGIDGWLFRSADNWLEGMDTQDRPLRNDRTIVWVCGRAARGCLRVDESRAACVLNADLSPGHCELNYRGRVRVAGGHLRVHRVRGELPAALSAPIHLRALLTPPQPVAAAPSARTGAQPARTCHFVVADPRPPLNVRAEASDRAAVVSTLETGTRVEIQHTRGGWLRLRAPAAGWVWSRSIQRVCP